MTAPEEGPAYRFPRRAPQNLGPGHTKSGRPARYNVLRLYQATPQAIAAIIAHYPQLRDRFIYITAHGYKRVQSPPDAQIGELGHLAVLPSHIGSSIAGGRLASQIRDGLNQFSEIEYIDLHILR